ncbi:MAG: peptidoglycan DD-metalloendopeptidase family protein [Desulfobulbaceae bacterium]|nr:MAG: peptidoglycan DD-metalloendopeptidase family protein [Desulfobulbaceae bacterium]
MSVRTASHTMNVPHHPLHIARGPRWMAPLSAVPGKSLIFCVVLLLASAAAAVAQPGDELEQKENVRTFRINIQRLQQGLQSQREQFLEAATKEKSILQELEEIDRRLADQLAKLSGLEKKRNTQKALISQREQELAGIRAEKEKVQQHLLKRINAYYKMGNIGLLNVIFSAQTLPELLRFHDSFQSLIEYDQNVIATYRTNIGNLERITRSLVLEKNILSDFIAEVVAEKVSIDDTRKEKERLLHLIRTQSKLHQQAIRELEKAAEDLTASLLALKEKEQAREQGFLLRKGHHPPPVQGTVIVGFGQETTNSLGIRKKSDGIAIEAPDGTPAKAICAGTVIHAGYLRGYGNSIIVHHGFQYYSIYSRLEKVLAAKGDTVKTGAIVGELGETATLIDKGMYFEIRHRSESLDPMQWLDTSTLQASLKPSRQ